MAMIENIYETMNLRITETAFELHLRKIYPTRNILSMRETETISGQACLDVQKKTDGSVNIIGEVATDPVASWMIQSAQVASKFTLFTHHAKTFPDLVTALRNSMLRAGVFKNEKTGESNFINLSLSPLAEKSSVKINIPTRYGKIEAMRGKDFFTPPTKLS